MRKPRLAGAYIVKAAESRSAPVAPKYGPRPPVVVTEADRALVRALLRAKGRT